MLRFAGTIFGVVAVFHLLRVVTDATFVIAGWSIPIWMNVLAFVATAILCGVMWWVSYRKNG